MSFYSRGFGDDSTYTGPGSPGYQYSSPDQIAAAQVGETYVNPAVAPMEYVTLSPQPLSAAQPAYQSGSSSGVADFFSSLVGGIFTPRAAPTVRPVAATATPSWLIPVALGVGALAIVAVIATRRRPPLAGRGKRRRSKR